jgi:hypothetical protein
MLKLSVLEGTCAAFFTSTEKAIDGITSNLPKSASKVLNSSVGVGVGTRVGVGVGLGVGTRVGLGVGTRVGVGLGR